MSSSASLPAISKSDLQYMVTNAIRWLYEHPDNDEQIREEMTLFCDAHEAWFPIALAQAKKIVAAQVNPWCEANGK
jgi:hypothetical protein